ncbi:MAG: tripartite tricarboxylate transporter substrate-binding protein [Pigmentiphaga sp.]|nr:tripartite tricarboxylate transporter substrate-binding protein [Pigmentiphaga sp.]
MMNTPYSRRHWLRLAGGATLLSALTCVQASEAEFPTKALRIVAPFSAGSGVDAIARVFAQQLSEQMGVPVVVENREGAGGMIGSAYAAKLPADGYSMLVATTPFVVGPIMQNNTSYDPIQDFAAVSRLAVNPLALTVHAGLPAKTMAELIAYAKDNPGELTYASSGPGTPSQLEMEGLKRRLDLDIREIPYRSNAQALTDMIAGTVDMYYTVQSTSLGNVQAGQVRALAVASPEPTLALPGVPTMAEAASLPGYESLVWYGFVVPEGTPANIVQRLNREVAQAAAVPRVTEAVQKLGFEIAPSSSEAFDEQMRVEAERATQAKQANQP